uniref:HMG box domain containing 4a n=1 Tax=Eptatretus burgeri TaxID=7764 RepID=A0A8C4Q2Z3_EPTBU
MAYETCRVRDDSGRESILDELTTSGRSRREKRRSYKDFLREEEETFAEAWRSSTKRPRDSFSEEGLIETTEMEHSRVLHKKKKKKMSRDSDEELYYSEGSHRRKRQSSEMSGSDSAMDLLKAIGTPVPGLSKIPRRNERTGYAGNISISLANQQKRASTRVHGYTNDNIFGLNEVDVETEDEEAQSHSRSRPLMVDPDGENLRLKMVLSPSELAAMDPETRRRLGALPRPLSEPEPGEIGDDGLAYSGTLTTGSDTSASDSISDELSDFDDGPALGTSDFSDLELSELEAGEVTASSEEEGLVTGRLLQAYYASHKKKTKKSKKKKERERNKNRKHKKRNRSDEGTGAGRHGSPAERGAFSRAKGSGPTPVTQYSIPAPPPPILHSDVRLDRSKKKGREPEKEERPEKKRKTMSAYMLWSKEYRNVIMAESPGIDFGEISKKLGEVWKQLPEKEKLVWKQKQQYLQHKQNKAEAMTVRRRDVQQEIDRPQNKTPTPLPQPRRPSVGSPRPRPPDVEPTDVAAHLQLLGESLSLIGHRLQETEGMVAVSGGLSVLLDSLLCALGPLTCLTAHVDELSGCPRETLSNTLDNIAYIMPGL